MLNGLRARGRGTLREERIAQPALQPSALQLTSDASTSELKGAWVKISRDGVGRAIDNVFIERLWRTLKYDHLYLNPAANGIACRTDVAAYVR